MIRVGTVFSGIGAVEHALKQLGIPHKIEFLARMRELICKKKPQLFKLLFVTALHAVYQG